MPKVSTNQRITFTQSREAGGTNRVEHQLVPVRKNQNLETVAYRSYLLKINVTFSYGFDVANVNASVYPKWGSRPIYNGLPSCCPDSTTSIMLV